VLIGWLLCLSANFALRPLTTFIPKFYAETGHPAQLAGYLLCLLFVCQGAASYLSRRLRSWLYRPLPLLSVQLATVVIMGLLWLFPALPIAFLAVLLLGLCYGFLFFACIYYVSNDVRSSRNVGINEAMVGIGNILGVLVSLAGIEWLHNSQAFYPILMASILAVIAFQWWWLRSRPAQPTQSSGTTHDALEFAEV
jgi:predicted MFS family arabinose efflux permease